MSYKHQEARKYPSQCDFHVVAMYAIKFRTSRSDFMLNLANSRCLDDLRRGTCLRPSMKPPEWQEVSVNVVSISIATVPLRHTLPPTSNQVAYLQHTLWCTLLSWTTDRRCRLSRDPSSNWQASKRPLPSPHSRGTPHSHYDRRCSGSQTGTPACHCSAGDTPPS